MIVVGEFEALLVDENATAENSRTEMERTDLAERGGDCGHTAGSNFKGLRSTICTDETH